MAAPSPASSPPSPPATFEEDVEPGHLPGPSVAAPASAGGAIAIVLLCLVVVLVVFMVTGLNEQIPYLHPASGNQVTVYGDRVTYDYEFVANGTLQNLTTGYLCAQCPFSLTTGARFALGLNITNPNNASEDVGRLIVASPFVLVSASPIGATVIASGLTEAFTLTVQAPSAPGTYVVSIAASINVS